MLIEPLSKRHDRNAFDCGDPALNEFIRKLARQQQKKNVGKTFVAVSKKGGKKMLGFYTLSAGSIEFDSLPSQARKKFPRYPIPVVLLGRFAVDRSAQNKGLGKALLYDAFDRICSIAQAGLGIVAVVVHAKNEDAKRFHEHYGFQSLEDKSLTLFIFIETILDGFGLH